MPENIIGEGPRLLPVADAVLVTDAVAQFVALSMPFDHKSIRCIGNRIFFTQTQTNIFYLLYIILILLILFIFLFPSSRFPFFYFFVTTPRTKTDNLKLFWGFFQVTVSGSNSSKNPPLCISFLTGLL